MKKTIYMILVLTGIIVATTACSNTAKEENYNLTKEVTRVTQENVELKQEIQELQQNFQKLDEEIEKLNQSKTDGDQVIEEPAQGESMFIIYSGDIDTYEKEIFSKVPIADSIELQGKLEILAENLSKMLFDGLGIEVAKVEDENGQLIATVNLTENNNPDESSWKSGYFQGSAGGAITGITLEETFLQREYGGEWIDGVIFIYEDQALEFDHMGGLGQTISRF